MQLFCLFLSILLHTIDLELGSIMIYVFYNYTNEGVITIIQVTNPHHFWKCLHLTCYSLYGLDVLSVQGLNFSTAKRCDIFLCEVEV